MGTLPDYLDYRNQEIKREIISVGSLNASLVHPREVFEPAVRNLAAQIILAHNHPSGDPQPSEDDITVTKRLIAAGKIMGIEVVDHIIVVKNGFFSFKEKGLLEQTWDIKLAYFKLLSKLEIKGIFISN